MNDTPPEDNYEQFVELYTRNEPALRAFARSLMPSWHDADEIVQEVALVAWRKFGEFETGTSFIKWICMIARFKSLAYRRKMARDRLSFNTDLMEIMAEEAIEESGQRQREFDALEQCLAKLPEQQRRFVELAYTPGIKIKDQAKQAGLKAGALYMRLNRIRATLLDCIEKTLPGEGAV